MYKHSVNLLPFSIVVSVYKLPAEAWNASKQDGYLYREGDYAEAVDAWMPGDNEDRANGEARLFNSC